MTGKPTVLGQALNILVDERFKTLILSGIQLSKQEVCTWSDLFEGSGLKSLGVSTNTLSSVLKALIKTGIVKKERAPFPWRVRYRLLIKDPYLDMLKNMMEKIYLKHSRQQMLKYDEPNIEELRKMGREAVEEWETISKATFLTLLLLGFEDGFEVSPFKVAFVGFFIVDYLFHATAHLKYEAREEAKRILMEEVKGLLEKEEMLAESIVAKMR